MTVILLSETVKHIHRVVITRRGGGTLGALSDNKIQTCLDFPFNNVYGHKKYRTLFQQAAALLFAFVTFHPFIDGNKRTGLVVTQLFLTINGYDFSFPRNIVSYVKSIAAGKIQNTREISKWLRENSTKSEILKVRGQKLTVAGENVYEILNDLGDEPLRFKIVGE